MDEKDGQIVRNNKKDGQNRLDQIQGLIWSDLFSDFYEEIKDDRDIYKCYEKAIKEYNEKFHEK